MKYLASLTGFLLYLSLTSANYADDTNVAINTLQSKYYNIETGLWDDMWWQSGNMIETIARFGQHVSSFAPTAISIISNTYAKSPNLQTAKEWHNDYYDDMGWWALAWIAAYDLTADVKYLNTAKDLFKDMTGGWNTSCNGGLWWSKQREYISAISNELFLSVGAHLANRVDEAERDEYISWAQREWDWFWNSGVINAMSGLINDGIDEKSCKNNGQTTYTYNQGVVLAGLSELARAKGDVVFIHHANHIAHAVLSRLTDDGILTEPVDGPLDTQSALFKGPFVRGLSTLNQNKQRKEYTDFLKMNADAAWRQPKVDGGVIVDRWQGGSSNANAGSHAAGIDVLLAAAQAS